MYDDVIRESGGHAMEPLNKPRAGATEALWDAVLGGSPKQYVDIARGSDNEMRLERPVPYGLGPKPASASSRSLPIFAILAASRSLHPSRFGPNALRVGLIQRFLSGMDADPCRN